MTERKALPVLVLLQTKLHDAALAQFHALFQAALE